MEVEKNKNLIRKEDISKKVKDIKTRKIKESKYEEHSSDCESESIPDIIFNEEEDGEVILELEGQENTLKSAFLDNNEKFLKKCELETMNNPLKCQFGSRNLPETFTAFDLFSLFITEEIFDEITFQTNLYQKQFFEKRNNRHVNPKSRYYQYVELTKEEIKAYVGAYVLMGIIRLPCIDDHWSTVKFLGTSVNKILSINKFCSIQKFFHLANNCESTDHPLYKVLSITEKITSKWKVYYYPNKQISLDETIIPFYGRNKISVYNNMKPDKWGFKVFTLCDANTYYCLDIRIYYGSSFTEHYRKKYNSSFKDALVLDMLADYKMMNHSLFIDSYYNSVSLMNILLKEKIFVTGTLKVSNTDKSLLNMIFSEKEKKAKYVFLESQNKTLLKINNNKKKKDAFIISSEFFGYTHNGEDPTAMIMYNKYKGGVDVMNRMIANYRNLHANLKFWKPIFWELIDISIHNSYILYKEKFPKVDHKQFRILIIEALTKTYIRPKPGPKPNLKNNKK